MGAELPQMEYRDALVVELEDLGVYCEEHAGLVDLFESAETEW
jgi:hypothetical protein